MVGGLLEAHLCFFAIPCTIGRDEGVPLFPWPSVQKQLYEMRPSEVEAKDLQQLHS